MFMDPKIDLRIKPRDIGIQVLGTKFEGMAAKHTSSTK